MYEKRLRPCCSREGQGAFVGRLRQKRTSSTWPTGKRAAPPAAPSPARSGIMPNGSKPAKTRGPTTCNFDYSGSAGRDGPIGQRLVPRRAEENRVGRRKTRRHQLTRSGPVSEARIPQRLGAVRREFVREFTLRARPAFNRCGISSPDDGLNLYSNSWTSDRTPRGMQTVSTVSLPIALCFTPHSTYTTTPLCSSITS